MNIVLYIAAVSFILISETVQRALLPATDKIKLNKRNNLKIFGQRQNKDGEKIFCGPVSFQEFESCEETTPTQPECAPYAGALGDLKAKLAYEVNCTRVAHSQNSRLVKKEPTSTVRPRRRWKRTHVRSTARSRTAHKEESRKSKRRLYVKERRGRGRFGNKKWLRNANSEPKTSSTMVYREGNNGICENIANCATHDWTSQSLKKPKKKEDLT